MGGLADYGMLETDAALQPLQFEFLLERARQFEEVRLATEARGMRSSTEVRSGREKIMTIKT
jgi:hypothetical protein